MVIRTDPVGAEITRDDGEVLGSSPYSGKLRKNTLIYLTIRKEGYGERREQLEVGGDPVERLFTLAPLQTTLSISTTPPDVQIVIFSANGGQIQFVDTKSSALSDASLKSGSAGRFFVLPGDALGSENELTVELSAPGYRTLRKRVRVKPFADNRFSLSLQQLELVLDIDSTPTGADIFERTLGFVGRTPLRWSVSAEDQERLRSGAGRENNSVVLHLTAQKSGWRNNDQVVVVSLDNPVARVRITLLEE